MRTETGAQTSNLAEITTLETANRSTSLPSATATQKQLVPAVRRPTGREKSKRPLTAGSLIYLETVRAGYLIPVGAIKMIEADHKRAKVYFKHHAVPLSVSLQYLETRLPAGLFLRANRTQILNTSCVESVAELPDGTLYLVLREGFHAPIIVSRRRAILFKQGYTL